MEAVANLVKPRIRSYWPLWAVGKLRGHVLSRIYSGSADKIMDHIWIGDGYSAHDLEFLKANNIKTIISVATGSVASYPYEGIRYELAELLDIEGETLGPHIEKMVPIIRENVDNHINTLIHCEKGASRSASIVAAYLIKYNHMSTNNAIIFMRSKRSVINPNADYIRQLKDYEIELRTSEEFECDGEEDCGEDDGEDREDVGTSD